MLTEYMRAKGAAERGWILLGKYMYTYLSQIRENNVITDCRHFEIAIFHSYFIYSRNPEQQRRSRQTDKFGDTSDTYISVDCLCG